MARADLLLKLVKAGSAGDNSLFTKVVESLIAEERNKQHHIVADQLADILKNQQFSKDQSSKVVPKTLLDEKLESFLFRIYPSKSLDDIVLKRENRRIIDEMV